MSHKCNQTIQQYLNAQLRPYNAQNLVDNLHKQFTKKQVQQALEDLVAQGAVTEKVFGRAKVYVSEQRCEGWEISATCASKLAAQRAERDRLRALVIAGRKRERAARSSWKYRLKREYDEWLQIASERRSLQAQLNELLPDAADLPRILKLRDLRHTKRRLVDLLMSEHELQQDVLQDSTNDLQHSVK